MDEKARCLPGVIWDTIQSCPTQRNRTQNVGHQHDPGSIYSMQPIFSLLLSETEEHDEVQPKLIIKEYLKYPLQKRKHLIGHVEYGC
jgi:hypothetical protein